MNWYYAIGGEIHGPVSRVELESLFGTGTVSPDTLVLQEGMYDWIHFVDLKKTTQNLPVITQDGSMKEMSKPIPENQDDNKADKAKP